jgi:geranylgeranyl reductase
MGKTSITNAAQSTSSLDMKYKVAVIGGGPSGACAAEIFAQEKGIETVMFERKMDNAKPCGGAIPLCMVKEFDIPESVVDRKVRSYKTNDIFADRIYFLTHHFFYYL